MKPPWSKSAHAPTSGFSLSWIPRAAIGRPVVAFAIAAGSLILGSVLTLWTDAIRDGTLRDLLHSPAGPALPTKYVIGFWLAFLVWAMFVYLRLRVDDRKADETTLGLLRAIHRTPNYEVVRKYRAYYLNAERVVAALEIGTQEPVAERKRHLAEAIQIILRLIAGMAAEYARADDKTSYGANIMLIANPKPNADPPYPAEIVEALRFYDHLGGNLKSLRAILYLPAALLLTDVPERKEKRNVPSIALPVPTATHDRHGIPIALAGAPWTFLDGAPGVYPDTRRIAEENCSSFAEAIRREVAEYFSPSGDGRDVLSMLHMRIGNDRVPVGVLNIDSSEPYLLGQEETYYPTFLALAAPIVHLLSKPVTEYARITVDEGEFIKSKS